MVYVLYTAIIVNKMKLSDGGNHHRISCPRGREGRREERRQLRSVDPDGYARYCYYEG